MAWVRLLRRLVGRPVVEPQLVQLVEVLRGLRLVWVRLWVGLLLVGWRGLWLVG
ncbi:hypothetical protein [Kribbella sp. NPDC004536]|uniref:hypothetical protein n=1 Tax=Kribbella sp. NPDC004536 TaxID=3364106 RepID=UPI0036AB2A67